MMCTVIFCCFCYNSFSLWIKNLKITIMIFCNHTEVEHLIDKYDSIEYLVSKLLCTLQLTLLTIELQQVRNQKILEEVSKKFFIWNNYDT